MNEKKPGNPRNFWVQAQPDGLCDVSFGPKEPNGGFTLQIFARDSGVSKKIVNIVANAEGSRLIVRVDFFDGFTKTIETVR